MIDIDSKYLIRKILILYDFFNRSIEKTKTNSNFWLSPNNFWDKYKEEIYIFDLLSKGFCIPLDSSIYLTYKILLLDEDLDEDVLQKMRNVEEWAKNLRLELNKSQPRSL
jgi:hypothetical protein